MPTRERTRKTDRIDTLLARGRLSGPAREEILERVLVASAGEAAASVPWWRRPMVSFGLPALAAAAALLVLVRRPDDGLTAKGAPVVEPALEVACATEGPSAAPAASAVSCATGQNLAFRVEDATEDGFLTAWAEPVAGGERVWYFVGDGAAPVVAHPGVQTLRRAVRLGAEQPPGAYRVHLLLSVRPLSREDALGQRGDVASRAIVPLEVRP
jgi:hypothetical protein